MFFFVGGMVYNRYATLTLGIRWNVSLVTRENEVLVTCIYAPINVKPEGGGGSGNSREFDHDAYPQGGDFDLTSCI